MMIELDLSPLLPLRTITYPNSSTAIDLIWENNEAASHIIKCHIAEYNDHGLDHLSIETIIAMHTKKPQYPPAYNYAKTNWKELNNKLKCYLPTPISAKKMTTCSEVDNCAKQLITAIMKVIEETIPCKKLSPHSKRWWNEQLISLQWEVNKLRNIYRQTKYKINKIAWRAKANKYMQEIARAKTSKWKEYMDNADGKTIWQIKKYVTSTSTATYVPTLDNAATNKQKVNTFQKAFFSNLP